MPGQERSPRAATALISVRAAADNFRDCATRQGLSETAPAPAPRLQEPGQAVRLGQQRAIARTPKNGVLKLLCSRYRSTMSTYENIQCFNYDSSDLSNNLFQFVSQNE